MIRKQANLITTYFYQGGSAMRPIVADILSLFQYVKHIQQDPRSFRPDVCPYCSRKNPRCHGHYARKADRENPSHSSLNPIWIFRFYSIMIKEKKIMS